MPETMKTLPFLKGAVFLFCFALAQSFFGRWIPWSGVMPEGDFVCLVFFSLSLGRVPGTLLGGFLGMVRDGFSGYPFGLGMLVLAGAGFAAGAWGERRPLRWRWQKVLFLAALFILSDIFFWLLKEAGSLSAGSSLASWAVSGFPSALLTTLIGIGLVRFLP